MTPEHFQSYVPLLVNYFLVVSVSFNLLLVWLLLRQKAKTPSISLFTYLVFLALLDAFTTLYLLNSVHPERSLIAVNARIILQSFFLVFLHYFITSFTFSRRLPKPDWRNIILMGTALLISLLILIRANLFVEGFHPAGTRLIPRYTPFYWLIIALVGMVLVSLRQILPRKLSQEGGDTPEIRHYFLGKTFPLGSFALIALVVAPYFFPHLSVLYMAYLMVMALLFYNALRFHLLEVNDYNRSLLPMALVTVFILLIFFFTFKPEKALTLDLLMLSIPGIVFTTVLGNLILISFKDAFQRTQTGFDEFLDTKIEQFSQDIGRVIEADQLWKIVAQFCHEALQFPKIAIVLQQYDIRPYQIVYLEGFSEKSINRLLSNSSSPLLDKLESEPEIINKFDYSEQTTLYKLLDEHRVSLVIPLVKQSKFLGIIFLGEERSYRSVNPRFVHLLKLVASQVPIALENIQTIQNILQAQKMAEIGMFASQLAHDFRSFINLVKMGDGGNSQLLKHARYMDKMVNDLLNYARPQELKLTPVNINQLIDMSLDLVQIPPHIRLEKNYSTDLPAIKVDIDQMRRVFTNLINNSIRAMAFNDSGRLKITTRTLRPASKLSTTPWIYIEILDEGVGIPDEFLERIFDPFFTTYKKEGGNGLGLAIVRQIITRHSGFIDVTSKPGKGTIFNIRLPYQIE
ncbi:MAG: hypothetical protein D6748_04260 [Calditrichaeota bacterium]|nr:MAG: hypothetical protein D6748_04260 [Calditrichota bacterium]